MSDINILVKQFNDFIKSEKHIVLFRVYDTWIKVSSPIRILNNLDGYYSLLIREADERVSIGQSGVLLPSVLISHTRIIPIAAKPLKWLGNNQSYPKDYDNKQS